MKPITRARLAKLLGSVHSSTFVSFTALTTVKTKAGDPVIKKLSRVNVCCGSYAAAINRRRAKEGSTEPAFTPKPRPWGKAVSLALVELQKPDKVHHYLSGQVLKARDPIYLVEQPPVKPGKRPRLIGIDKASIAHLLPADRSPAAAQGLSDANSVIHRDYSLEGLSCVSMGGEVYKVTD